MVSPQLRQTIFFISLSYFTKIFQTLWWWCYPTPSKGWDAEELCGDPTVGPRSKLWIRAFLKSSAKDGVLTQMRDNPEGSALDPAVDNRRGCKKDSPFALSCLGKRTKEGCDRCNEVWTVHSGRGREGPVPLRKLKESGKKRGVRKVSPPGSLVGVPCLFNDRCKRTGYIGDEKCRSGLGE